MSISFPDNFAQASERSILEFMNKVQITNSASTAKTKAQIVQIEKGINGESRNKIKDTYNSNDWMLVQGGAAAANAVGLGYFGYQATQVGAAAAQSAVTAAQLVSSMLQPLTGYFTNRDQAAREYMQSDKQTATTNRDHSQQEISAAQQAIEQNQQMLRETRSKDGQTFSEMCR